MKTKSGERSRAALPSHRFFHAMVVMGGAVALGCGGAVTEASHEGEGPGAGDASGGGGSTSASEDGSSSPTLAPDAGVAHRTADAALDAAPSSDDASVPDSGPAACAPAQWSCAGREPTCGMGVPFGCPCDAARPKTAADCQGTQTFVCRNAGSRSTPIPFECSCVSAPSDCGACGAAYGGTYDCTTVARDVGPADVLCGCAIIYLK